jgi:murein DD-endopeptidase MepM/ murein hydrolase activator NlpD
MVAGDFNGDGKDYIAIMYGYDDGSTMIHVLISTGTSFSRPIQNWFIEPNPGWYNANNVGDRIVAGDFNGDGKDDIAIMYGYDDGRTMIHVFISTGTSFNMPFQNWFVENNPGWYNANNVGDRMVAGDLNGDGKDDIATMYGYDDGRTMIHVFLSTGTTFNRPFQNWFIENNPGWYDVNGITWRAPEPPSIPNPPNTPSPGNGKLTVWPVPSGASVSNNYKEYWKTISSDLSYNPFRGPNMTRHDHAGVDFNFAGIYNKPVVASGGGVVVASNGCGHIGCCNPAVHQSPPGQSKLHSCLINTGGWGNYVTVYDKDTKLYTIYAHLYKRSDLKVNDSVKAGDLIGYVGCTGSSTGPHLHFELRLNSNTKANAVDPLGRYGLGVR